MDDLALANLAGLARYNLHGGHLAAAAAHIAAAAAQSAHIQRCSVPNSHTLSTSQHTTHSAPPISLLW